MVCGMRASTICLFVIGLDPNCELCPDISNPLSSLKSDIEQRAGSGGWSRGQGWLLVDGDSDAARGWEWYWRMGRNEMTVRGER
jgi:hypothetical protein